MAHLSQQSAVSLQTMWSDEFWTFACHLYKQPGMQAICLDFQDNYQGHVNGLLFAIWCDVTGHLVLSQQNLVQLTCILERSLAEDIAPIRQARLTYTDKSSAAYQTALTQELAAEKRQQQAIIQWAIAQRANTIINRFDNLLQTRLYVHQHMTIGIAQSNLKMHTHALINDIDSIIQRAMPSV